MLSVVVRSLANTAAYEQCPPAATIDASNEKLLNGLGQFVSTGDESNEKLALH